MDNKKHIYTNANQATGSGGGGGGTAASTTFSPNGDITASNVQNAIVEVRDDTDTKLASKANTASPAFTGNPTAPTQSPNDNSTKLATTAYVEAATTSSSQDNLDFLTFRNTYNY